MPLVLPSVIHEWAYGSPRADRISHRSCAVQAAIPASNSMMETLPSPNNPPDAEDWENYKTVILDLYVTQNLPLPDVRTRMIDTYGFVASERMYKGRFLNKWNVRKHIRQVDVDEISESMTAGDIPRTIHGRDIPWDRLIRRLKRPSQSSADENSGKRLKRPRSDSIETDCTVEFNTRPSSTLTEEPVSLLPEAESESLIRSPDLPLSIYDGCRAFVLLQTYLDERLFSADLLEHFFGPVQNFALTGQAMTGLHASNFNANYARGIALLRNNRVKLAAALLGRASSALEHLVVDHHPAFASCFLDAFVEPKYDTHKGMSGYVSDLAVRTSLKTLGADHPITVLSRFVRDSAKDEAQMEQLLFFCAKFCGLFSERLGKCHRISAYVNLKHFAKLLQLERLEAAHAHFVEHVEPAFVDILDGPVPRTMRAASLCYLRRKAHLMSLIGDRTAAEESLSQCVTYAMQWLAERDISVAGNPLVEECFRLIDEVAEFLFNNGHEVKGIDLHSFAIGLCAAVRGEREGKSLRMISAQLERYEAAGHHDRVRIMQVRFPNIFADDLDAKPTDHILACPHCGNGPDTQLWCDEHRLAASLSKPDKVFVKITRECLADLRKWFGMSAL
jgi:hypothetical protein